MEVELVFLLRSEDVYARILAAARGGGDQEPARQENIYGVLRGGSMSGAVLRLRSETPPDGATRHFLTLKANQTQDAETGAFRRVELETEIPDSAAAAVREAGLARALELPEAEQIRAWLAARGVGRPAIEPAGHLLNRRLTVPLERVSAAPELRSLRLELDRTEYDFGAMFYVEVETTDPAVTLPALRAFLVSLGLVEGADFKRSTVSKFGQLQSGRLDPFVAC